MTMELSSSWPESLPSKRKKAIEELSQGLQLTNKLRQMLRQQQQQPQKAMSVDGVVVQILEIFDKAISILSFNQNYKDMASPPTTSDAQQLLQQVDQSVQITTKRGCYKRRKTSWTSTKVTRTMIDDGYAWRKYGQKMILNTKHQRNYYRCTHKFDQGCQATKQVQKTEDEPPKYKIIYNGHHTCKNLRGTPQTILDSSNTQENMVLLTFKRQGLIENKQVNPSLGLRCNQASSFNQCLSRNPTNNDTQAPLKHIFKMSSGLDHNNVISSWVSSACSNRGYHTVQMLGKDDFGELCL